MAKRRIPIDEFLPLYLQAFEDGLTRDEFAERVGLKPMTVYQRIYELREQNPDIPLLKTSGRATTSQKVQAIMAKYRNKAGAKVAEVNDESEEVEQEDPLADILG